MTREKELIERRKHRRFPVKYGAFAIFNPKSKSTKLGQIIDISRDGLAFSYFFDSEEWSEDISELDILFSEDNFYLANIPFETVSECVTADGLPCTPIIMKKRGVQFGKLTPYQISQLEYFLYSNTNVESQSPLSSKKTR